MSRFDPRDEGGERPLDPELLSELLELGAGDASFAGLITRFLDDASDRVDLLGTAISERSADNARQIAHTLRGGSASLAAVRMAGLCADIEAAAAAGDLEAAACRSFPTLEAELVEVRSAMYHAFLADADPLPTPSSLDPLSAYVPDVPDVPDVADVADIGVLIVDDHRMFAETLAHLLAEEVGITVRGIASGGAEGVALAARLRPQVVLIDHQMPDQDGVVTARAIRRHDPAVMVVMLTASTDERVLVDAIEAGCSGYLTKDRAVADVVDAVRAAAAGEALISPAMLARLLPKLSRNRPPVGAELTEREVDVLALMAKGATNKVIADELYLSVNTIRNHVQSILSKLHAHSKLEAVSIATSEGLVGHQPRS